jgi:hypothetical protein
MAEKATSRRCAYIYSPGKTDVILAAALIAGAFTGAYNRRLYAAMTRIWPPPWLVSVHPSRIYALAWWRHRHAHDHRKMTQDLANHTDLAKMLSAVHLGKSQSPEKISSTAIRRPEGWGETLPRRHHDMAVVYNE